MADLYGELLSNALNRKAPRDHFAAYINPREAAMLRSQGGGVAPGGGQYMANGLPAFIEDVGAQAWGGSDLDAAPSGWGLDYAPGIAIPGTSMRTTDYDLARNLEFRAQQERQRRELSQATAPAVQATTAVQAPEPAPSTAGFHQTMAQYGLADRIGQHEAAVEAVEAYRNSLREDKWDLSILQELNARALTLDPNYETRTDQQNQALFSRPISDYGTGQYSPAAMLSGQGATAQQSYDVNQQSASGGYAVNDPSRRDVSVPAGYHMGFLPSAMGSLIGMANPAIGLAATLSGFPTWGARVWDAVSEEIPEIGQVANFLGAPGRLAGDLAGRGFAPVGGALTAGAQRLGDVLQGVGSGDPVVEDSGALSRSMAGLPEGGFDPPFVREQPDPVRYAGVFPGIVDSGERWEGEKEVAGEVSPEILARLEANAAAAEERLRRMGMLA
jgi:hypothetical protein